MKRNPKITVIVLNYNGLVDTRSCLNSLLKQSYNNFTILVIDNGSINNEAKILKTEYKDKKITIQRFNKNYGFAGGNNRAIQLTNSEYVVLLNQDATVKKNWLTELAKSAESDSRAVAFQSKVLFSEDHNYFEYAGAAGGYVDSLGYPFARGRILFQLEEDKGQYDDPAYLDWACGSAILIKNNYLNKVGGLFDDDFFAYQEEIDFSLRVKRAGFKVKFVPKAVVYHRGVVTNMARLNRKIFWTHRNNLYVLLKNFSTLKLLWLLPLRILLDCASMAFYLLSLRLSFLWAVIKAYGSFVSMLPKTLKKRKELSKKFPIYADDIIYGKGSILFKYFIQKKKRFTQLKEKGFFAKEKTSSISHSLYYGDLFKYKQKTRSLIEIGKKLLPFFILALFTFLVRYPFLNLPLNRDEGAYAYIGYQWLHNGLVPYRDVFDQKAPLTYIIYGFISYLYPNYLEAIRIFSVFYLFFTSLVLYFFAKKFLSKKNSLIASVISIFILSYSGLEALGFNTEVIFMTPLLLGYFTLFKVVDPSSKKKIMLLFLSGVLIGAATLIKQVAGIALIGASFYLFIFTKYKWKKELLHQGVLLSGFLAPVIIFLAYFISQHALHAFIQDVIVYNRLYVQDGYAAWALKSKFQTTHVGKLIYLRLFTMLPPVIFYLTIMFFFSNIFLFFKKHFNLLLLIIVLYVAIFIGIKLGGTREVAHYYYTLLPVLALGFCALFIKAKDRYMNFGRIFFVFLISLFFLSSWIFDVIGGVTAINYNLFGDQQEYFKEAIGVSKQISNLSKKDTIFVWANEPEIYAYAKKEAVNRDINFYEFYMFKNAEQRWWIKVNKTPPTMIVAYNSHDEPMYSLLQKFFITHKNLYKLVDQKKFPYYNVYVLANE